MENKFLTIPELPKFLPFGWRTEVAKVLKVHPLTVTRNVKKGKGVMYDKIVRTAALKYGKKEEVKP